MDKNVFTFSLQCYFIDGVKSLCILEAASTIKTIGTTKARLILNFRTAFVW